MAAPRRPGDRPDPRRGCLRQHIVPGRAISGTGPTLRGVSGRGPIVRRRVRHRASHPGRTGGELAAVGRAADDRADTPADHHTGGHAADVESADHRRDRSRGRGVAPGPGRTWPLDQSRPDHQHPAPIHRSGEHGSGFDHPGHRGHPGHPGPRAGPLDHHDGGPGNCGPTVDRRAAPRALCGGLPGPAPGWTGPAPRRGAARSGRWSRRRGASGRRWRAASPPAAVSGSSWSSHPPR